MPHRTPQEVDAKYKELQTSYNVPDSELRKKCSDVHTFAIEDFIQWEEIGPLLPEITNQDITDIGRDLKDRGQDLKRRELLKRFHQRNANKATYEVLIKVMLSKKLDGDATKIFKLLKPSEPGVDDHQDPPATPKPPNRVNIPAFKLKNGKTMNILTRIGTKYENFGIQLLNDEEGTKMGLITMNNHNIGPIMQAIIQEWLTGTGKLPVSWETLASVIDGIGFPIVAKDIREGAPYQI